jgi:hypothetical protein
MLLKRAKNYSSIHYLKSVEVALQPLTVKLTEGTVEDLYTLYTQFRVPSAMALGW